MIERLTMVGLDRRGGALPEARSIAERVHAAPGGDARAGVVLLATCERFEAYVAGSLAGARALLDWLGAGAPGAELRILRGATVARHLLRVAAGLDSRLVGETHVLGQVRRAAEGARDAGMIGPELDRLFSVALRCGKRVRRETSLGRAGATYATLAAKMALEHVAGAGVGPARIGIIGTGSVALDVGEALRADGEGRLVVFGRHGERTRNLARHLGAEASPLEALTGAVRALDALITATSSPRPLVRCADLAGARPGLIIIDLGMPPNVGVAARARAGIVYRGLDDVAPAHLPPCAAIAEAETIVEQEMGRLTRGERAPARMAMAPRTVSRATSGPGAEVRA